MVEEILVNQLRKMVARFEKEEGVIVLLILTPSEGIGPITWDLIISSPAFEHLVESDARAKVLRYLNSCVGKKYRGRIWGVTPLRTDHEFVKTILRWFPQFPAGSMVQPLNIAGFEISTAFILEKKTAA